MVQLPELLYVLYVNLVNSKLIQAKMIVIFVQETQILSLDGLNVSILLVNQLLNHLINLVCNPQEFQVFNQVLNLVCNLVDNQVQDQVDSLLVVQHHHQDSPQRNLVVNLVVHLRSTKHAA